MNHIWKTYFRIVKPYRWQIAATVAIGILKFGIPFLLPFMIKYVVDDLLLNDAMSSEDKLQQLGMLMAGALLLFVVVRGPVEFGRQYFAQWTSSRILFDMRNRLYDHVQKLSISYFQNRKAGEITSRFMNDVEQTRNLVEIGLMNVWLDMFTLTLALGLMFYLNPTLTLAAIAIFPLYGLAVKFLYKRLKQLTKDRSQALAEIQGYLHERMQGIPVIRSFTLEAHERGRFQNRNSHFLRKAMTHTRWNALTFSIINTLTDIAPLIVIGYGGYQTVQGDLSVGAFTAFFVILDRLYNPLRRLVNSSTALTQATASLERVVEFMNEPYDITDQPSAKPLQVRGGEIRFHDVSFRYHDNGDWALEHVDLTIPAGRTTAIVGMSGGGKSSLVGLIPRFFDIQKGKIAFDGQDIRTVTQQSLRQQIGMVLQDNILFSGSVKENILLGRPEATDEEVIAAAQAANAHHFIEQLPHGYDTEIGERGVKLSGGQKQRIAIARVFLKNPAVLILDEATSALDLESESLIQHALAELAQDRTTLIVAHRLSTITHADQIVVMEHGRIVEKGRHEQLMRSNGAYAKLYNIQKLEQHKPLPTT
ncbi:ABC transporter ATP-binding protein [Xylanibacillus composti]|uniref:Putative multidrug export ATP-binding/permease protein YgaD n=1 Tax=Xylanibacillus composti TaxID=1572762 RepID=A0A8J4H706_9BACL|nr:ABC transporter ATP-binding protein [Xylanibacillus composti]MDT9724660.1 ABC transporter ATP-binding protein [Xylanibacillus composti]GIQ70945.1 putative multidrug export ATP-binding/permease protein YgaD [Xylanibacillus composti]